MAVITVSKDEIEALKVVRNMAYDFATNGDVLPDKQVETIDMVDAVLFRMMGITVVVVDD